MIIAKAPSEVQTFLKSHPGKSIGFAPTMGYLHSGHLSLLERSKKENDLTLTSIFVNPAQFTNASDLLHYPKKEKEDIELLEELGVDLLFLPSPEVMYPPEFSAQISLGGITELLEGASRPGHFDGVTLVVSKLFHITSPDRAYFGQKDYQQLKVIEKMVKDLNFPIEIVPCPTSREEDGLAMSSRNARLTPEQRAAAPLIYQALQWAVQEMLKGNRNFAELKAAMGSMITETGIAKMEYISFNHAESLQELQGPEDPVLISLAALYGETRLIDNVVVQLK